MGLAINTEGLMPPEKQTEDGVTANTSAGTPAYHATLTFKRAELLYDIRNYAYIEGHIMPEEAEHARHMTKDVGEEGNVDRVTRLLNLYHAKAVEMLYPYAKHDVHTASTASPWEDRLEEPETYRIDLLLPRDFSQTTLNVLEHLVHEYLVCHCLADWLSITNTEKAEVWAAKATEAEAEIRSATAHRRGRIRRTLTPF